ncbi:MAG: MerR family transcriptional regulator [Deltaproteobacteria bacterium]|nr:MerR family transcriptional regulator [Deltaproteobacteria bacterium]
MTSLVRLQVVEEEEGGAFLRVGDLAREVGKTVRAMHLYEELGLLKPAARSKGGFRLYREEAVVRVRWIGKLQDMGFSLQQISEILHGWEESKSAPRAMCRVSEIYGEKLKETQDQISRLAALERELVKSLGYLDTCGTCDPVRLISSCCCCDVHEGDEGQPDLVAGLHRH